MGRTGDRRGCLGFLRRTDSVAADGGEWGRTGDMRGYLGFLRRTDSVAADGGKWGRGEGSVSEIGFTWLGQFDRGKR